MKRARKQTCGYCIRNWGGGSDQQTGGGRIPNACLTRFCLTGVTHAKVEGLGLDGPEKVQVVVCGGLREEVVEIGPTWCTWRRGCLMCTLGRIFVVSSGLDLALLSRHILWCLALFSVQGGRDTHR